MKEITDLKSKRIFTVYWKHIINLWTGKKAYPTFKNAVLVPIRSEHAKILNKIEYKIYPELYGNKSWQRPIPK